MKTRNIPVHCVITKLLKRVILHDITCQSIKVLNFHASIAIMKQQITVISWYTLSQYMKEGNISVSFVPRNTQHRVHCGNTRNMHMNVYHTNVRLVTKLFTMQTL